MRRATVLYYFLGIPFATALLQYNRLHPGYSRQSTSRNNGLYMRLNPSSFEGTSYTITDFPGPSLRRLPNADIENFKDEEFQATTQQMMTIMYAASGVGLAAPQIGLNQNFFVYNPTGDPKNANFERIVCNPTIKEYSKEIEVEEEACLSLRSDACAGSVARAAWIQVEYQNELGQLIRRRLKGFEARVFQHEYDHLKGILCWDRFPPEDREAVQETINTLLGLYTDDDAIPDASQDDLERLQPPRLTTKVPIRMPQPSISEDTAVEETAKSPKGGMAPETRSGFGGGSASNRKKGKKKQKKK